MKQFWVNISRFGKGRGPRKKPLIHYFWCMIRRDGGINNRRYTQTIRFPCLSLYIGLKPAAIRSLRTSAQCLLCIHNKGHTFCPEYGCVRAWLYEGCVTGIRTCVLLRILLMFFELFTWHLLYESVQSRRLCVQQQVTRIWFVGKNK